MILLANAILFVVSLVFTIIFFVKYSKNKRILFLVYGIIFTLFVIATIIYGISAVLLLNAVD